MRVFMLEGSLSDPDVFAKYSGLYFHFDPSCAYFESVAVRLNIAVYLTLWPYLLFLFFRLATQ